MRVLHINNRFAEYFEELDYGQMTQLEKSLKSDLTSEPILWWHNPERDRDEVLDGHHRYAIAKRCKLELQTHEKHFANEDEALLFIIRNQTTRRNLSNRERIVKLAVDLEIRLGNKSKTQAVKDVAEQMDIGQATVWRSLSNDSGTPNSSQVLEVKPLNPVEMFKVAKTKLEREMSIAKTRAVEKFKVQAQKEQMDEDTATARWQDIEAEIDDTFADDLGQLEELGQSAAQAVEDNPGLRNTGKKRPAKKSVRDRAARRNTMKKALSLIGKLQSEVLYFWDQTVGEGDVASLKDALRAFIGQVEGLQEADAKAKKKKFGR